MPGICANLRRHPSCPSGPKAADTAGRVDRDELTFAEEILLADALEAAVAAVLPQIVDALDDALTPRLESLPLHARLTLARARGRNEYGVG